jgi:hypothetical protein
MLPEHQTMQPDEEFCTQAQIKRRSLGSKLQNMQYLLVEKTSTTGTTIYCPPPCRS